MSNAIPQHTVTSEVTANAAEPAWSGSARVGAWMFRHRSWLPIPLAVLLVTLHRGEISAGWPFIAGPSLVLVGECLRWWSVRHIGSVSRSLTDLGPLTTTGPFRTVRNPLYVGNWLIWTGFVVSSRMLWMLPVAWAMFAYEYGAIVRWEEARLTHEFGDRYARYLREVPRWIPNGRLRTGADAAPHRWRDVALSERGTLLAIVCAAVLLILKAL